MAIDVKIQGRKMVITADLTNGVPSKTSGRNLVVASTGGFTAVNGTEYKVSLLVIKPIK